MVQSLLIYNDFALFILRISLALIFLAHGWPKIKDLKTTAVNFNAMDFKPGALWGTIVAFTEFFGGVFMLIGLFTQLAGFILALEFAVILVWKLKTRQKFIGGIELDLIIFSALLVMAASASPLFSIDNYFGIYLF